MSGEEWARIVKVITANWPHQLPPVDSLDKWGSDLEDLEAGHVLAGVEALYRDGREFPPNGGQIREKVRELEQREEPDHGEAWAMAMTAVGKFGWYEKDEALPWLEERSVLVAEAVRRFGYRDLCMFDLADVSIVRAQFREIFKSLKQRAERNERYIGLPQVEPKRLKPRSMREVLAAGVAAVPQLESGENDAKEEA